MNTIGRATPRAARRAAAGFLAACATLALLAASPPARADFASDCGGCHVGPTEGGRVNAAGSTSVISRADTVNGMGTNSANWAAIASEIATALGSTSQNANVAYGSTNNSIAVAKIVIAGSSVLSTLERVSGPTSVSFTAGSNSLSYDHTAGNCSNQTLVVRGRDAGSTAFTSNRTINISVTAPPDPVAANDSTTINYSTSATGINLRTLGAVSGTGGTGTVTLGALSPNVGSAAATGAESLSYTSSSTVYAPQLTIPFTVNGPCGTSSATRTLTINVNPPPAPVVSHPSTAGSPLIVAAGASTPINLGPTITGVVQSNPAGSYPLTASQPTVPGSGSTSVAGNVVTYDPGAFVGATTFTYTKTGPGGVSNTETVFLEVTAAPVVSPTSATTAFNTAVAVNLAGFISSTQPVLSVTPSSPVNGTATQTGTTQITFTPTPGFFGTGSFNYVATNAGGTSATPATVTITVNPPPPTVAPTTLNAAYNGGSPVASTTIDLAPFITGPFTSVTPSSPVNGTVSVAGSVVTFTPTAGYIGPASFAYTATNAGGTSAPATVSVTVVPPPPPTASNLTVRVSATAPTVIDLGAAITGLYTSVAIASPPGPGSVTLAGAMATYKPQPGFTGQASFTFTATGIGGTSAPGTVTLVYTTAPVTANRTLTVPFNTSAAIDLTSAFSGVITSWSVSKPPQHGTVSVNGPYATYTPFKDYFGPDAFEFTAVGPGGTSTPGVVSVTVLPPVPSASGLQVDVAFNTATTIDLSPAAGGTASTFTITQPPQNGTVTIAGSIATYTPNAGFAGADSFSFVAVNATGTSAPATVSLNVASQAPTPNCPNPGSASKSTLVSCATLRVPVNGSGTIDLAPFISGSLITGVAVSVLPTHGLADVDGTKVTYTPRTDYFGTDSFTYVAFGNAGTSQPVVVNVSVEGRPDPAQDRTVVGIVESQAQAARRFARAQIGNYQRRLEALHAGPPAAAPPPAAPAKAAAARQAPPAAPDPFAPVGPQPGSGLVPVSLTAAGAPKAAANPLANRLAGTLVGAATSKSVDLAAVAGGTAPATVQDGTQVWLGGLAHFGKVGGGDNSVDQRFSTDGVSLGADRRLSDRLVLGLGLGYGRDRTDIGDEGSRSKASGVSFAGYGSYQPSPATFIDAVLGFGTLDLDTDRYVASHEAFATAKREGTQFFGSVAAGWEMRREGWLLSPYGRLDFTVDRLDEATESGAGPAALTYHEQTLRSTSAAAGIRFESRHETDFGWAVPRARLEYRHDFEGGRTASVSYADLVGGLAYSVTPSGSNRNSLIFGLGADFLWRRGLSIGVDYQGERSSGPGTAQAIRFLVSQDLDGHTPPWPLEWLSKPLVDAINVEAGFAYDDNVSRGRLDEEKLSDQVYSFGLNTSRIFPINPHLRAQATALLSVDKFHDQTGLGRTSGGLQGELQYRASGDFDATTWALFARGWFDSYESKLRSGGRLSVGANARRSLTDRIDLFGELGAHWRRAESAVFEGRELAARLNLDYSLGAAGTAYLTGEYRRGDTFASGFGNLWNLNNAEVFVRDDALEGGDFFAYRFEADTVLGTLGYNRPLGPRDSIDFSYRRVRTKPLDATGPGPSKYDVNQYFILYLMRF